VSAAVERALAQLPPEVLDEVRRSVHGVLSRAPVYAAASPEKKRELAKGLVDLGVVAAGLMNAERKSREKLRNRSRRSARVARAQSAGDQLGMQATRAAAGTLTGLRDALDFPTYVGSLITGVFQAILNSSTTQIGSLSELVDGVGVSAEDYASSVDDSEVARWLVGKFPKWLKAGESPDSVEAVPGIDLEEHAAEIQRVLGAEADASDPSALLDSARLKMAQDKQKTLATMIQMGLQRIVVDEGRIHASMDLRVDAQSGSQEAKASREDWRVNAGASGSFGYGPWGASVSASTSVGQVHSDAQLTNEQIGARAGLRSSVELAFRTDQVPLDKVASRSARAHLDNAARSVDVGGGQSILAPAPSNFAAPSLDVPATPPAPQAPQPPDLQAAAAKPPETPKPPADTPKTATDTPKPPADTPKTATDTPKPPADAGKSAASVTSGRPTTVPKSAAGVRRPGTQPGTR